MKLLFAAAAVAALSPAAYADTPGQAGHDVGKCVAKADRDAAVNILKSLPLTGGEVDWAAVSMGAGDACRAKAKGAVTVTALRGGIAEGLFIRDFREYGVDPHRNVANLADFKLPVEKDLMGAEDPTKTLFLTADCVARSNPLGTEKLIKAAPGSGQEAKIFESLAPWLSACQGASRMAYGKTDLRSAIVQAAYHVSARYWAGSMTYAGPAFRPEGTR